MNETELEELCGSMKTVRFEIRETLEELADCLLLLQSSTQKHSRRNEEQKIAEETRVLWTHFVTGVCSQGLSLREIMLAGKAFEAAKNAVTLDKHSVQVVRMRNQGFMDIFHDLYFDSELQAFKFPHTPRS